MIVLLPPPLLKLWINRQTLNVFLSSCFALNSRSVCRHGRSVQLLLHGGVWTSELLPTYRAMVKVVFIYSAVSSPLDRPKRCTLFALPGRPVHSDTNSASPGSILAMQQLRATTKSLACPPLSIARYSFIQLSQLGRQWRERKCPIFKTLAKRDSNPGSLDCESGILPLSYCAPLNIAGTQYLNPECSSYAVMGRVMRTVLEILFTAPR